MKKSMSLIICILLFAGLIAVPVGSSAASDYKEVSKLESVLLGFTETVASGITDNPLTVSVGDSAGMIMTVNGWHASTLSIQSIGYSIDDGEIIYDSDFIMPANPSVKTEATNAIGADANVSKFAVLVPLTDNRAHTVKIYSKDGNNDTCVWTINKKMNGNYMEKTTIFSGSLNSFYSDGNFYSVRLYQNGMSDASFVDQWGGMDGIGDKKLSRDAVLFVSADISLKLKNCRRVGLLVDDSYIIWPENELVNTATVGRTDGFLQYGSSLGNYGFMFDMTFDTSTLSSGSHVLKIVLDLGNSYTELGTRTSQYGGGCFVINVTSTGANYVEEAVPEPTEIPPEGSTPAPTSVPTDGSTQTPEDPSDNNPTTDPNTDETATQAPTQAPKSDSTKKASNPFDTKGYIFIAVFIGLIILAIVLVKKSSQ